MHSQDFMTVSSLFSSSVSPISDVFDDPALGRGRRQPVAHVRIGEHGGHVGRGRLAHLRAVGAQAQHHRRVHRVGHAVFAEQPRTVARRSASGIRPTAARCARFPPSAPGSARSVRSVARAFMGHCERRIEKPACISAHAARATARAARSLRPAASGELAGIFADRQRIPDAAATPCCKHRHTPRGAQGCDVAREFRRVERQHALGEREVRDASSASTGAATTMNSSCCPW